MTVEKGENVSRTGGSPASSVGMLRRLSVAGALLVGLQRHDLRAARTFIDTIFQGRPLWARLAHFVGWLSRTTFADVPNGLENVTWQRPVSKVPIWLAEGNPLANYPFSQTTNAQLPQLAEVVVIGAGFTGAALGYHWSKRSYSSKQLVILEMGDPAGGASGRNAGIIVMGRYYAYVHKTVLAYLDKTRTRWNRQERDKSAHEFAVAYCRAAYVNSQMIEETIRTERFDCGYDRKGWVQLSDKYHQEFLQHSVSMARASGFDDWTSITPHQAWQISGVKTDSIGGFSVGAARFDPAKWVWGLIRTALKSDKVQLFTRTKVLRVEDAGEYYRVKTERGTIVARYVVSATESYTPLLYPQFHNVIQPVQTQAAFGTGVSNSLKQHIPVSNTFGFFTRHENGMIFGSDATKVPDQQAGRIQPSRFITKYTLSLGQQLFGRSPLSVTHEWSGTVGYTPDEFPVVGLMDDKRQYVIGGMAGSGTAVSFNAAHHVIGQILNLDQPDYYPEKYFSPSRFISLNPRLS